MDTQKGPIKTTVLLKGGFMGFHVSLGQCMGVVRSFHGLPESPSHLSVVNVEAKRKRVTPGPSTHRVLL